MRIHNRNWNIWGRRITSLLLLCGLLLPILPQAEAASVTYEYNRITSTTGLPTDDQWHDYFIAWEDTDNANKFWFADYHWYTPDGYHNYDAGGSHWMEYRAASTLPDTTSASFTSKESLGHMQIKYAGKDEDNNSPMYFIRVSKMNGGYMYFTEYEPSSDIDDAEPFTFEDKGDVFHIYVNISGKADRYLTRDGQNLETTESSSYGGGESWRPLRVYQRTFTVDEETDIGGDKIGKVTLYEYSWVNTVEELLELANSKQWTDILLAWENANGEGTSDPDTVWYTKEYWEDAKGNPNYNNDGANEWRYFSNDCIDSDGYGSTSAERFLLPSQVGHFQVKPVGWDSDNPVYGASVTDWGGDPFRSPVFHFRFNVGRGKYIYIGNNALYETEEDAVGYTTQLRLAKEYDEDIIGSVWIFNNMNDDQDEFFCREDNLFAIGNWNHSDYWEFPFRIYSCRPVEYDAIVKSFTIGKGATYTVDRQLILAEGVTITVEDGGVLTVDKELLNNGKIIVKKGGTVVVNGGAHLMAYDYHAEGTITLDGGNLIVMDDAKVLCDLGDGILEANNGATIVNRGLLMVSNTLSMNNSSCLINEPGAWLLVGAKLTKDRGSIDEYTYREIDSTVEDVEYTQLVSNKSKFVDRGKISTADSRKLYHTSIDTNISNDPNKPNSFKPSLDPNFGNGSSRFG